MQTQQTTVMRSAESMATRRQSLSLRRADDAEGFICLMLVDNIIGFTAHDDEEIAYVLEYKCKSVCFENMKEDRVISDFI